MSSCSKEGVDPLPLEEICKKLKNAKNPSIGCGCSWLLVVYHYGNEILSTSPLTIPEPISYLKLKLDIGYNHNSVCISIPALCPVALYKQSSG